MNPERDNQKGDDLRARFPDPETDERLRQRPTLPDPPRMELHRPTLDASAPPVRRGGGIGVAEAAGMGRAMAAGSALIGSLVGGIVVGALADRFALRGETPWGLIVGFLLGAISGFANLIKIANEAASR